MAEPRSLWHATAYGEPKNCVIRPGAGTRQDKIEFRTYAKQMFGDCPFPEKFELRAWRCGPQLAE